MPLDIVLAGSGLEDGFLARARAADIGGATVPLIDLQDLIIAKLLASRPQDLADAQNLSSTTCPPSSGVRAHCQRRRSANGAGDRPPAVLPRYRPAATSRSQAPSRPPDRRRSDRSYRTPTAPPAPPLLVLANPRPLVASSRPLRHRFSHLDCRSVLILIVVLISWGLNACRYAVRRAQVDVVTQVGLFVRALRGLPDIRYLILNSTISFGSMFEPLHTTIYFELWISFGQPIDDVR